MILALVLALAQQGNAKAAHQVVLNWQNNEAGATFTVYQDPPTGPPGHTAIASGLTATNYVDTSVMKNKQYCYHVTASVGSVESQPSNEVCVTVPK